MESTAGPSRSEATPEERPTNQVVIDRADLEELIGSVVRREMAKLPGTAATTADGGAYRGGSFRVPPPVQVSLDRGERASPLMPRTGLSFAPHQENGLLVWGVSLRVALAYVGRANGPAR